MKKARSTRYLKQIKLCITKSFNRLAEDMMLYYKAQKYLGINDTLNPEFNNFLDSLYALQLLLCFLCLLSNDYMSQGTLQPASSDSFSQPIMVQAYLQIFYFLELLSEARSLIKFIMHM